jgi:hypothetical protein
LIIVQNIQNFCLWYNDPSDEELMRYEYVSSIDYPIGYPKYNIEGVDKRLFFYLSYKAETENNYL